LSADSAKLAVWGAADDDMALVQASKAGDIAAFEKLVNRYDRKLLRVAQNITHNLEDAQDAVQDTFLKAFQKLDQFQANSKFSTWLIRIVLNQSLMVLRKNARSSSKVEKYISIIPRGRTRSHLIAQIGDRILNNCTRPRN
jgi:RNA polymerase sigma factor (sigma-70 family)